MISETLINDTDISTMKKVIKTNIISIKSTNLNDSWPSLARFGSYLILSLSLSKAISLILILIRAQTYPYLIPKYKGIRL